MRKSDRPRWRTTCLINPKAANSKWLRRGFLRARLQEKLPGEILDVYGNMSTTVELAKKASADSELLVAIGGDGTIADALQGLFEAGREKDVLFGIVPYGSGNAFRKSFGIPKDPDKAIRRLASGQPREADVIRVEDRYAGFISVGATAAVTEEKSRHAVQGLWGHVLAARGLVRFPREERVLEMTDGIDPQGRRFDRLTVRSCFLDCVVAKTNYFGYGWAIAPRARIDDGYLDITLFEISGWRYLLSFPFIYLGLLQQTQPHFKARTLTIRGRNLPIQYNGEVLGRRDEVTFRILPRALKIICPRTRKGGRRFKGLPLKIRWPIFSPK